MMRPRQELRDEELPELPMIYRREDRDPMEAQPGRTGLWALTDPEGRMRRKDRFVRILRRMRRLQPGKLTMRPLLREQVKQMMLPQQQPEKLMTFLRRLMRRRGSGSAALRMQRRILRRSENRTLKKQIWISPFLIRHRIFLRAD